MVGKLTEYIARTGEKMIKILVKKSLFDEGEIEIKGSKEDGGLDEITLSFDKDTRVRKDVNLYTFGRIMRERKKGRDEGFEDGHLEGFEEGYEEGFKKGLEEGYQRALADIEAKKQANKKTGTVKGKEGRNPEISTEKIQAILQDSKRISSRKVAEKHGVSRQTVLNIINGKGRFGKSESKD